MRPLIAIVAGATAFLLAAAAWAHAGLMASTPAADALLSSPPAEVVLEFSERVEPAFSTVAVTDAAGRRLDAGQVVADPGRPTVLHVPLSASAQGKCRVDWRAVSVDTHVTKGRFAFEVR